MREACSLVWSVLALLFRSRASLEAEILILRHQLNIQRRHLPRRVAFRAMDRLVFVGLYRLVPGTLKALTLVRPATVVRWHRAAFRAYWRWKSRPRSGRPKVPAEIRRLIREMSMANPLWGAPRIHGELLKLGIEIDQTSVARRPKAGRPSSALMPTASRRSTISFRLLYGLLIMWAWSTTDLMVWRHGASDRGVDRQSAHGSLRLGPSSPLSHP
jgi:hypothetical protein